jgi:hypothetical protein
VICASVSGAKHVPPAMAQSWLDIFDFKVAWSALARACSSKYRGRHSP